MMAADGVVVGVGVQSTLLVLTLDLPLTTAALTSTDLPTTVDGCDGGDVVVGGVGGVSILGEASAHKLLGVFPLQFIQDHGAPGGAQDKDSKLADAADGSLGNGKCISAHTSVNYTL